MKAGILIVVDAGFSEQEPSDTIKEMDGLEVRGRVC